MPYSQRNPAASEIIPRLYISDLSIAEDASHLASLGITHVLSAMRGTVAVPSAELRLRCTQVPLEDFPFAELADHLPGTTAFLRDALRDPNARVLVHCAQGISRSASVVAAFLIASYGWTPPQAIQYVKSKRRIAEPNFGFVSQLHEYAAKIRR
ncbi:hypothetical protein PLICRDRAFT_111351 [Plicaturopsis crispa FD-325 SS-3]|nr:hypothetical protein PLICRDRAFT_111351 [Plicaturopsis crispa FD-325 SS-3]